MAGLLSQSIIDALDTIAQGRVTRANDLVRSIIYRPGSVPPGMEHLDHPDKISVFGRYVGRRAVGESQGSIPGNLGTTMQQHPAVADMLASAQQMPPPQTAAPNGPP